MTAWDADRRTEVTATAPGAVVVTSHERWLRQRWTGPVLALDGSGGAARP